MKTNLLPLCISAAAAFLVCQAASADDVRPPDFRGLGLSVFAEWTNVDSVPPDQPIAPTVFEAFPTLENPLYDGFETNLVCTPLGLDTLYLIEVQNIIDDLPLKLLRLQITTESFTGPAPEPQVFVTGFDAALLPPDSVGVGGGLINVVDVGPAPPFRQVFVYDFFLEPNPDFEIIEVIVPEEVSIEQVVVDSISIVPEPAVSALLFGSVCLVFAFWRRRHTRD
ncbi:MAG: PEP-CTERM sorting domain-containing protein [Opitutales bacterium]